MYKNKTFLAVIPARGGSKRLPNKNLLDLCGKPTIAWSIEAGLKSKYVDKVIVSSEDKLILDVAKKFKAETIERPDKLASDTASTFDVISHTLKNIENYNYVLLLQPTSPLRNEIHIDQAIKLLDKKNADAVISVCEMDHSPLWSNTLNDDLDLKNFLKDGLQHKRSQDLDKFYRINGAIYLCKVDKLMSEKNFFLKEKIFAYIMNRESSIDIDEAIDHKIASIIASNI